MLDDFLQAFGLLALALASVVLWTIWRLRRRFLHWYHYGMAASIHRFPGRIHLRPMTEFRWLKSERAAQRVKAFRDAGFADLGGFGVDEIPDARLFVLRHPGWQLIAVVHEQAELGTWSDVLAFKGSEPLPILASSILKRAHLLLLPGDPRIHRPAAAETDLIASARQAAGREILVAPASLGEFQARFERAFADAVDDRLLQPLEDYELRRLITERSDGALEELDEKLLAALKRLLPDAINNELRLVCSAQFLQETTLAASDWKQARERLAIIHDRTPLHELAGRLVYGVCCTPTLKKLLRQTRRHAGTPRERFAQLNGVLPPWERYQKIGEVSRPVAADIYRAPLKTPEA